MSIASGVTGGSQINCYNTEIIERTNLNNVFGFNTGLLTLPLITTNSTIKTQEEVIPIDSLRYYLNLFISISWFIKVTYWFKELVW